MAWVNAPVSRQAWCSGLLLADHTDLSLVDLTDLSHWLMGLLWFSFWMTFTDLSLADIIDLSLTDPSLTQAKWPSLTSLTNLLASLWPIFSDFWLTDLQRPLIGWPHWDHLSVADVLWSTCIAEWPSLKSHWRTSRTSIWLISLTLSGTTFTDL